MTIGEKRTLLVRQAKGRFACFVDDDDNVSPDYIQIIRRALEQVPDADVVQMRGAYYVDDCFDRPFFHSLTHQTYWEDAHGFYRPPNHLNVTRTYIMQTIPFQTSSFGEDTDYALRLAQSHLLQTEAVIGEDEILYHYYYVSDKKTIMDPHLCVL
jgi:hypothetical protein